MIRSLALAAFVLVLFGCTKQNGQAYDSTATTNSTTNSYNSSNQSSGGATAPAPTTGSRVTPSASAGGPGPTDTTAKPPDTLHR